MIFGDRDFAPLIGRAYKKGWESELWGFSASISHDLALMVSRVHELDAVFDRIGRYEN